MYCIISIYIHMCKGLRNDNVHILLHEDSLLRMQKHHHTSTMHATASLYLIKTAVVFKVTLYL